MTEHNDGLYISDTILSSTYLSWREKFAYGYMLKYSINKDMLFIDPRMLAHIMQIGVKEAVVLMVSLKEKGVI